MQKNKTYTLIWLILLAAFNAVVFLVRPLTSGYTKYDAVFWAAWSFIHVAFIGNLFCAYLAFKAENSRKLFYNMPLITVSWSALIAMLAAGCILMLIPNCPAWIAAVICILILAFNAIAVIKVAWAADTVSRIDEKIKVQTSCIKNLTVDAEGLLARAKSDAVKTECKKVYETIRYSDPMSNEALSTIEAEITVKMGEFAAAVGADDAEKAKDIADEIVILVGDRNKKCKVIK